MSRELRKQSGELAKQSCCASARGLWIQNMLIQMLHPLRPDSPPSGWCMPYNQMICFLTTDNSFAMQDPAYSSTKGCVIPEKYKVCPSILKLYKTVVTRFVPGGSARATEMVSGS